MIKIEYLSNVSAILLLPMLPTPIGSGVFAEIKFELFGVSQTPTWLGSFTFAPRLEFYFLLP